MVAQGHGKFGPIIVADLRKSFRVKKKKKEKGDFEPTTLIS